MDTLIRWCQKITPKCRYRRFRAISFMLLMILALSITWMHQQLRTIPLKQADNSIETLANKYENPTTTQSIYASTTTLKHHTKKKYTKSKGRKKNAVIHHTAKPIGMENHTMMKIENIFEDIAAYDSALKSHADKNKTVLLSIVDHNMIHLAVNFYQTSILKLNITNHLLICLDRETSRQLHKIGVPCQSLFIKQGFTGNKTQHGGDFGSSGYKLKTNLKTIVVLHAIKKGYQVLLSDVDVVLFKNPFPYFGQQGVDVFFQMDRVMWNSGFVFVRPTPGSILLYSTAWEMYLYYHSGHDQAYISMAIRSLQNQGKSVKIKELSSRGFPCGSYFFDYDGRIFGGVVTKPCPECVMTHNNYIGSVAAKEYRFKENLLWEVDENSYYSNPNTKYLIYENPFDFGDKISLTHEMEALKNALFIGYITERIVILPSFRCCDCKKNKCSLPRHRCSLLSSVRLKTFDDQFKGQYREHSFLENRKVPDTIKTAAENANSFVIYSSIYKTFGITFHQFVDEHGSKLITKDVTILHPKNFTDGASAMEISTWFGNFHSNKVLKFHSLYGRFDIFTNNTYARTLNEKFEKGFQCSNYEQWESELDESVTLLPRNKML